jgi:pimeloyl-ACP methyl ester carboxylesterase
MAGACLFFPGIAGNEINWRGAFFTSQTGNLWLNKTRIALGSFQWLQLDPTGTDRASTWYPFTTPGAELSQYYTPLMNYLSGRDWVARSVQIDWRKTIAQNAEQAVTQIRDFSGAGPLTLVGHSRGGMVAAAACQLLSASGQLGLIRRGVSIGTPWRGSYTPIGYLGGYDSLPLLLNILGRLTSLNFTALVAGPSVRDVVATWPGLYELLPDPAAAAAAGDPNVPNIYNSFLWEREGLPVSAAHLASAQARWATHPGLPQGLTWAHIVGTGFRSKGPLFGTAPGRNASVQANTVDGDGTVPTWSATALGGQVFTTQLTHFDMPNDSLVHGLLEGIFQGP